MIIHAVYTCCYYFLFIRDFGEMFTSLCSKFNVNSHTCIFFQMSNGFCFPFVLVNHWIIRYEIEITDIPRVGYLPSQIILIYYFRDRVGSCLTCESYRIVYSRSSIDVLSTNFVFVLRDRDKTTHRMNRYIYREH